MSTEIVTRSHVRRASDLLTIGRGEEYLWYVTEKMPGRPPALPVDRYISVDGVRLRYWQGGEGDRAVVLVHGVGSYVERWRHTFEVLSACFRVYAMDLPGRGLSDKPADFSYRVENLARIVKGFTGAMGLERTSLVGSSLGGAVVACFARQYPGSVDRLVLSSSAGWGRGVTGALRIVGMPGLGELIGRRQSKEAARRLLLTIVKDPSVVTDDLVDLHYRMSSGPGAWKGFLRLLRANGDLLGQSPRIYRPLRRDLRGFTRPTLVLWGEHDRIIPPRHADIILRVIPNARKRTLAGCGHFLMLERADEYASIVLDFLDAAATDSRRSRS